MPVERLEPRPIIARTTDLPRHTGSIVLEVDDEPRVLHRFSACIAPGVTPAGDAAARVLGIRLLGIDRAAVLRVRVLCGDRTMYDLAGYRDTRGRRVPAGDLISSMAWLECSEGMSIRTEWMRMTLAELMVEVQAAATAASCMAAAAQAELQT
jgi:hypothetical protein